MHAQAALGPRGAAWSVTGQVEQGTEVEEGGRCRRRADSAVSRVGSPRPVGEGDGNAVRGQQGAPDVFGPSTGSDDVGLPTM